MLKYQYFFSQAAVLPFFILRLRQPPAIRLIDTTTHKSDQSRSRSQTPIPASLASSAPEPDLLAGLSFSSRPIMAPKAPVFGLPSLLSSLTPQADQHHEADEMDVDTPTDPKGKTKASDTLWLRPQRFFAPEAPTGLEGLFERTKIVDDVTMVDATSAPGSRPAGTPRPRLWNWWWVYASSLIPLAGIVYKVWQLFRSY